MSKLFDFTGDNEFHPRGLLYSSPKDSGLFFPFASHVDVYFPSRKRSRISAPFVLPGQNINSKKESSIEVLPDECLFEILRRLQGPQRSACAGVSQRWLSLLSNINRDELSSEQVPANLTSAKGMTEEEEGSLSRCLEGKKATDVRLAAIAVGAAGLAKLSVHGVHGSSKVTNIGLKAISCGCPALKILSLWNLTDIDDNGLLEIANGCHLLEKLDISRCPRVTGKGLVAIAKSCPKLTELVIDSCPRISNEWLQGVGFHSSNLKSLSIKDCPLIGDQGISSLVSSSSHTLSKVKLHSLNVTDIALAVIGHYGKAITDLSLTSLCNVSEKGFWVMGNAQGLQILKSLSITSCKGVTDVAVEAVGKGCASLRAIQLRKCAIVSDNGVVSFTKAALSLETLHLEECHRITHYGVFGSLINCSAKLKAFSLVSCLGIQDLDPALPMLSPCKFLKTLSVHNCPGFGDKSLSFLATLCPHLQNVELVNLPGVTNSGVHQIVRNSQAGLAKVNLSGCVNISDGVVSALAEFHPYTLETLNLANCRLITDTSLESVSKHCKCLNDLDLSKCAITDAGIAALALSGDLNLQILSIGGCTMVSQKSVPSLIQLGKTLMGLNLQHCNAISSGCINAVADRLFKCDILY